MLKKWLYIAISFWLINSVTYFHASTPADYVSVEHTDSTNDACVKLNTWADIIAKSLIKDDDDASGKAHRIKYQIRYIRNRSANDNVFVSAPNSYIYVQHLKDAVEIQVNHYTIGMALLPSYYNFLFRLCPF